MALITIDANNVLLQCGGFKTSFARNFGGAVTKMTKTDGTQVIYSFAGAAFQAVWDQGADPTEGSADGPDAYQLARLGAMDSLNLYRQQFAREVLIEKTKGIYETASYYPAFWISHEEIDDWNPVDSRGPSGWVTNYNNFETPPKPLAYFGSPGVPIGFTPRGVVTSGIKMLGNTIAHVYNLPEITRACKFREPKIAITTRISLKDASADAIAGIYFFKDLWTGFSKSPDINETYNSNGYVLNINRAGGIEIRDNSQNIYLTASTGSFVANNGIFLHLISDDIDPTVVHVYTAVSLDAVPVHRGSAKLKAIPSTPTACGLFAACASGYTEFSHRNFFDRGGLVRKTSSVSNGNLKLDYRLYLEPDMKIYRFGIGPWLHADVQETYFCWDKNNTFLDRAATDQLKTQNGGMIPLKLINAIWSGKANGSAGVKFINSERTDSQGGHSIVDTFIIGTNPLEYSANMNPVYAPEIKFVTEWKTTI